MYNYTINLIPAERQTWRSAYEIQMAALKHEERRIQIMNEDASAVMPRTQSQGNRKAGLLSVFKAPLRMLAALIG